MSEKRLRHGDRIKWTYYHALNYRTETYRTKHGIYWSTCRHTSKHWRHSDAEQMAWVQFDGNKRLSRVPLHELKEVSP